MDSSESSGSLSPPVPDAKFDTHTDARQKIFARLDKYQALNDNDDDDTVHFLRSVFRFLPIQGQVQLAVDAEDCNDDDQLRQLAKHLDTALLRPMVTTGGKTPAITPCPCPGVEDSIENLLSQNFESTTRQQAALRRACLQRDNHQCQLTKFWDFDYNSRPPGLHTAYLEAAHIIPFGLGNFRHDERLRHAQIWQCLYRYFPTIRDLFHRSDEDINRIDNVMMLVGTLHQEFGRFSFILEETNVSDRYRVKTFSHFRNSFLLPYMPDKFLLAVHAAIGNILHATGRAELIAKTMKHLEEGGCPALAKDGSTNVEKFLSVTGLSLLAINPSHRSQAREEKHSRHVGSAGAENQRPSVTDE
ncbi:uncharacterized protein N7477_009309 [Penicillium maclennaniae]|uniref:uncharacterized protein n=1 Tax=Penicillium maclennaniae TaxID=1343394 RepID=UPI0025409B69|nr:uncharacterized protein N7477_009309 [Penicillium maclennaniae]KAJ5661693.1 hypothetical protein N7477_009309 [Penicillium maclennaniae]